MIRKVFPWPCIKKQQPLFMTSIKSGCIMFTEASTTRSPVNLRNYFAKRLIEEKA